MLGAPRLYKFKDSVLELLHEEIEKKSNMALMQIAEADNQDSTFYHLRGFREALTRVDELIIEMDKNKYKEELDM